MEALISSDGKILTAPKSSQLFDSAGDCDAEIVPGYGTRHHRFPHFGVDFRRDRGSLSWISKDDERHNAESNYVSGDLSYT